MQQFNPDLMEDLMDLILWKIVYYVVSYKTGLLGVADKMKKDTEEGSSSVYFAIFM